MNKLQKILNEFEMLLRLAMPTKVDTSSIKEDIGYKEMTLGKDGEVARVISRPTNYDLVKEETKNPDGTWTFKSYVPERVY